MVSDHITQGRRPYALPPMTSLISFEAAARNGGFKVAAGELNVTAAAISHQVKALEQELGCTLFRRHHRGVELTEAGAYLLVALQRGLQGISEAVTQLRAQRETASVTVRSTTAVSSLWLTPRLARFWREYPHISVSQVLSDHQADRADCDLSIHYGRMDAGNPNCRSLFVDQIIALASPAFAEQHAPRGPADLANIPLIHLEAADTGWTDWSAWLQALGHNVRLGSAHRVNNYVIALQAAQDDMGAVLGWKGLTVDMLASGKLVQLLPQSVDSPLDFYVELHNQASDRARILFDWLSRPQAA